MNLISCDNCGVVLDADKMIFPKDIWTEDGEGIDLYKAEWSSAECAFVAKVQCPVCGDDILKPK